MATLKVKTRQLDTSAASMQTLVDFFYPVGSFYVQYPDAEDNDKANALPSSKNPLSMWGVGTWEAQFTGNEKGGIFFKTEGDIYSQTDGENNNRTSGLQTDMIQSHKHNIPNLCALVANRVGTAGGYNKNDDPPGTENTASPIDDGTGGSSRAGKETRPMNRLIRIWKRTA